MAPPEPRPPAGPTRRNPVWLLWAAGLLLAARIALAVWEGSRPVTEPAPATMRDAEARPTGRR